MHVLGRGLLCIVMLVCCVCAAGAAPPDTSKAKRAEVNKLLKRYRHAAPSIEKRQQIVDEAIALGAPFTVFLRDLIGQLGMTDLQKYRAEFASRVGNAHRLTPEGVVAASKELTAFRAKLSRSLQFALQLEQRSPNPLPEPNGDNPDGTASSQSDFEQRLTKIEADLIQQWLVARGLGRLNAAEAALVVEVNRRRAQLKLVPLAVDYKLCAAARDHSLDMKQMNFFSHKSKAPGKKTFSDRARRYGTTAAAENIASCSSAPEAMALWMLSPPHKRNILGKSYRRVGVGRVGRKFTMMFGN